MLSLVKALFRHGEIKTTEARAKELRKLAEHLITVARTNDVHSRRQVFGVVRDKAITKKVFSSIAPRFAERNGGYTRAVKLGSRRGDGASMVLVKLLE
jgi:large subunit ribosomal protein L17